MTALATVVGIDLGGTKILGRAADPAAPLTDAIELRVDTPRGADAILQAIAGLVADLDAKVRAEGRPPVQAVGLGAAGLIDLAGVLRFAPNLPTVIDCDFATELRTRTGRPVVVDNDANCATRAELDLGAARGATEAVLVTLGTGIGAGNVVGGAVQRGAKGFAGEPGHMVVDPNGPPCPCGRRGCWERYASGSGLGRFGRDAAAAGRAERLVELAGGEHEAVRGEHVTIAAREGDPGALEILRTFGWWVALGIANLVSILDPEVVVVGGGLVSAGDALMEPVREAYRDLVLAHEHRPPVRIEPAVLGNDAGAIGAALLAAELLAGA